MNKLICVAYIAGMTGITIASVGQVPKPSPEPYTLWLPVTMFFLLALPAILGYRAGKEDVE